MKRVLNSGAITRAKQQRQEALDRYYFSPNICKQCGSVIHVDDHQKVGEVRKKKFCNSTCSSIHNNTSRPNKGRQNTLEEYYKSPNICLYCKKVINVRNKQTITNARKQKCCSSKCSYYYQNYNRNSKLTRDTTIDGLFQNVPKFNYLLERTKQDTFDSFKNWQSARTCIRRHAAYVFELNEGDRKCAVCGYDKHFEICHIKAVSDFPGMALITEINDFSNLIGLCPNHHWEFDNGLLNIGR